MAKTKDTEAVVEKPASTVQSYFVPEYNKVVEASSAAEAAEICKNQLNK